LKINLFSSIYSWTIAKLTSNNNHSLNYTGDYVQTRLNLQNKTSKADMFTLTTLYKFIEYQDKKHAFNWLDTLHVTFTIPRYRLGCWYRPFQEPCIDWCYRSIHGCWTGLYQHLLNDKEFCCSLIGLNSIFLVIPQSEFTSREPQGVYSGFQRCPRKNFNFKFFKISKTFKYSSNFKPFKNFIRVQNFHKFSKW
jgi:hypothetical protein